MAEIDAHPRRTPAALKPLALVLIVAALGLPVIHLFPYALLVIAAVMALYGRVVARPRSWLLAAATVIVAMLIAPLLRPQPIAEGDNVFLPGPPGNVLQQALPGDVYAFMQREFDALYPRPVRCTSNNPLCWTNTLPDRAYGFSADSIFGKPVYSRLVTSIDFSDPVWLRLGFINDLRYNWSTAAPDVHRADRDRRFWMGLRRWHLTMPWFVMYEFPTAYTGAELCWRGDMLWQNDGGGFATLNHPDMTCRRLVAEDIGRKIFGIAVKPDSLNMTLHPPLLIKARLMAIDLARLVAVIVVLALLVRVRWRDVAQPFTLMVLALAVIAVDDASFIGGWRPMDGGDDGLFYTSTGRLILQQLLDGHFAAALAGGEDVYYYGGPGLRYLRALEMIVFGDTNLGYLSLVLAMPVIVLGLFRRFLNDPFAWRLALVFVAVPVGAIVGTTYFHYVKWAARGFADPAMQILTIWGVLALVGARANMPRRFAGAFGAALLLALAVFVKPLVAPLIAVMLGGAGIAALAQRRWPRVAGLCIGFSPVLLMPLHNWYFGHVFVPLTSSAQLPQIYIVPPSGYLAALAELARLDLTGAHLHAALAQIAAWLREPSESWISVPFNAIAVVIVVYVTARGRDFDPWLRLIGAAVIAEYVVDLIYAATPRYFFEMWLLTALVVTALVEHRLPDWLAKRGWQKARRTLDVALGRAVASP